MNQSNANPTPAQGMSKKRSQIHSIWLRFQKNKLAMLGLIMLILLILLALCAPLLADYENDAIKQNMSERLQSPNANHPFGTDQYGRDLFARVIHGARISLLIGTLSVFISLLCGSVIGSVAGYYGGRVDDILMRLMDVLLSIPSILMALCIVAALGASLPTLIAALTISSIPGFSRIVRSAILSIKGQEYIESAKAYGTNDAKIILKHILPNAIGPIIVQATLNLGSLILITASLSFIGLGVQPPMPEWGTILSESRNQMRYYPYLVIIPGLAIVYTVFAFNLIGDGLRDALDPRLKN